MSNIAEYPTLDRALEDIANRSFYESARVYKTNNSYIVEDWPTDVEESQEWNSDDGLINRRNWLDYSRVHDPAEYYDAASHVRYNLDIAVTEIESGEIVGFTYVMAEELCDDESLTNAHSESECLHCDGHGHSVVGWALIATNETIL